MCEKAEQSGLLNRSKLTFQQIGQNLQEELQKQDKITAEEENMIIDECDQKYGNSGNIYNQIDQVLLKILDESKDINQKREKAILKANKIEWTNKEVAQLLIAVFNLGEGEWLEIQKRINFQSSGFVKTPNQIAHRWRSIKRIMVRDIQKLRKTNPGKMITNNQWIISTLRTMTAQDPELGIEEKHLKVLEQQLFIDPNLTQTPFQRMIDKY